ncbi:MAG: hypothetical protein C5B47_05395 [Verrucomicrobia bacterium]|nr:MAG: hypothetical protein C5B47_05395 [Verrucomicrobiota bacterium]
MTNVWQAIAGLKAGYLGNQWHWGYWVGLITIFTLGGIWRFTLPLPPIMDPDTVSYLNPAIEAVTTGSYSPTFRSFLYPFFLIAVLKVAPQLEAITFVQHILGLVTAVLIVITLFRSGGFLPKGAFLNWGIRFVAMFVATVFLFSRDTIILEHSIRPEGVFPLFCIITILSGVQLMRRLYLRGCCVDWQTAMWAVMLMISSIGNLYLKPAWGLAAVTSLVPLVLIWRLVPGRALWKSGTLSIGVVVTFCAVVFPGQLWKRQYGSNFFLPGTLLAAHAEILYDIFQKDVLRLPSESKKRHYLLEFMKDIQSAMESPSVSRYGFRINPDDILYGGAIRKLKTQFPSTQEFSKFCFYYYLRAWLACPVAMVAKVCKQMQFFYLPRIKSVYDEGCGFPLERYRQESLESVVAFKYPACALIDRYRASLSESRAPKRIFLLPVLVKYVSRYLNYTFFPLFILSAVGGIATWHFSLRQLQSAAALVLYFSSFNFFNCLTISTVHMMDVNRYRFSQIAMSLVSQGFQCLFLFALVSVLALHCRRVLTSQTTEQLMTGDS